MDETKFPIGQHPYQYIYHITLRSYSLSTPHLPRDNESQPVRVPRTSEVMKWKSTKFYLAELSFDRLKNRGPRSFWILPKDGQLIWSWVKSRSRVLLTNTSISIYVAHLSLTEHLSSMTMFIVLYHSLQRWPLLSFLSLGESLGRYFFLKLQCFGIWFYNEH